MTDLLSQTAAHQAESLKTARREYVAIVQRAARNKSLPADAPKLAELLPRLSLSAENVERDMQRVHTFDSDAKRLAAIDCAAVKSTVAEARAKVGAHEDAVARSNVEFSAKAAEIQKEYNAAMELEAVLEGAERALSASRAHAGDLVM
jgi:hypothetical protein